MASPPPLVRSVLLEFWRASRLMLLLVSAMTIGTACASLAAPYLFSRMVDRFDPQSLGPALTFGLVAYAVLVGFSSALARAQAYLANVCGERLALIVSTTVFDRVMRKTAAFFVEHNPVQIETAARRGEEALMTMMHLTVGYLVTGTVQIVIGLALIGATMSLEVVAVSVLYGAGFIALSIFADRRSKRFLDAAIAAGRENAVFVGNVLTGMETLRHFGAQGWMRSVFAEKANAVFDNWRAYSLGRIGFAALQGAALAVQLAVTFFMLLPRLEAGLISVGDIVLFNTLILTLNEPFEAIGVTINELAKTRGSLSPLRVIWQAPEEHGTASAASLQLTQGTLRFKHVGYRYENGRGVEDISFTATRGGITTLTGETGAGKSTVFRLALKSIEPQTGTITIDGQSLATLDRTSWHARVGVVPQDILLLSDTLAVNITLGRPLDMEKLRSVAAKAAILSTIDALPDGFETSVGERGLKLSGGERQRIAIARALYGDPDILFLDEASSALDAATEGEILQELRQLADRVTVVAITHRTGMIAPGDTVVRIGAAAAPVRDISPESSRKARARNGIAPPEG